jgi:hypothetical protein
MSIINLIFILAGAAIGAFGGDSFGTRMAMKDYVTREDAVVLALAIKALQEKVLQQEQG